MTNAEELKGLREEIAKLRERIAVLEARPQPATYPWGPPYYYPSGPYITWTSSGYSSIEDSATVEASSACPR
jgi:hypothetical protein